MLGFLMVLAASALFLWNQREAELAEEAVTAVLPQIIQEIPEEPEREVLAELAAPEEILDPSAFEMTEVVINGYAYIGYLSLPALELELPILSDWTYKKLQISPCRYFGSVRGGDMVIMAHNYPKHFGNLSKLRLGDSVVFTDMDGVVTKYQVVGQDVLSPDAVEEMTSGEYDLTLFTCTYGGKSRVTVYCDEME